MFLLLDYLPVFPGTICCFFGRVHGICASELMKAVCVVTYCVDCMRWIVVIFSPVLFEGESWYSCCVRVNVWGLVWQCDGFAGVLCATGFSFVLVGHFASVKGHGFL